MRWVLWKMTWYNLDFLFPELGIESMSSRMLDKCSAIESHFEVLLFRS